MNEGENARMEEFMLLWLHRGHFCEVFEIFIKIFIKVSSSESQNRSVYVGHVSLDVSVGLSAADSSSSLSLSPW